MTRSIVLPACVVGILATACSPIYAQYDRRTAIVKAIAKTRDAIVNIRTMRSIPARFSDAEEGRVRGLGTGVIIDPRGYVVTNYHVIEKVNEIKAVTSTGREFPAVVLNSSSRSDLAVLKLQTSRQSFSYLPLWGAGDPILGELVIAIGNPYGLDNSVTTGIVSAVNRVLKLPNGEVFNDLIQTDASINPGNSGGPLLNVNGDLLGVNVAIRSNAQGIGFAIPTRKVREVVRKVMRSSRSIITRQGLVVRETSNNDPKLVQVVSVDNVLPDSPAFKVGFRKGDKIDYVAGQRVANQFDLERILWGRRQGEPLTFKISRDGKSALLKMPLGEPPPPVHPGTPIDELGIKVSIVSGERVRRVLDTLNGGLLIHYVKPGTAFEAAGLRAGDILFGLHDWETVNISNVRYVMKWKDLGGHQPISCHYIRDGKIVETTIHLPAIN